MGMFAADGQWVAAANLYRYDPRDPFRPTDVAFLRLIAPAIGGAFRAAFAREQATRRPDATGPDASGLLLLAPNGRIRFANAAASVWLDHLRESWQAEAPGVPRLPAAVWAAVAGLRSRDDTRAACVVCVLSPVGPLRVEASVGDEAGSVAVILAPERPPAPALPLPDWPLTPGERRVLALVARGLGNRQIAAALVVAVPTVESHLVRAYDKLGVHSRGEFLARFFRETTLPELAPPDAPVHMPRPVQRGAKEPKEP